MVNSANAESSACGLKLFLASILWSCGAELSSVEVNNIGGAELERV